ncbi:hypothetical protein DPEC_G00137330 [Dallia pectoralis]|uniref:Uncharacterized protein n=1 Tax=Dallia pectoralis TaxID=75939 RepID=A0ACC2GLL9_DALPE|nr:hypothetical protein DPEC_G00137330 [Dallia pectoralis]
MRGCLPSAGGRTQCMVIWHGEHLNTCLVPGALRGVPRETDRLFHGEDTAVEQRKEERGEGAIEERTRRGVWRGVICF